MSHTIRTVLCGAFTWDQNLNLWRRYKLQSYMSLRDRKAPFVETRIELTMVQIKFTLHPMNWITHNTYRHEIPISDLRKSKRETQHDFLQGLVFKTEDFVVEHFMRNRN